MIVVGLSGPIGVGKSYIAKQLSQYIPQSAIRSFARPLKELVTSVLFNKGYDESLDSYKRSYAPASVNIDDIVTKLDRHLEDLNLPVLTPEEVSLLSERFEKCETEGHLYRVALQLIGTEIFRKRNPNYWRDHMRDFMDAVDGFIDVLIIDDVRFPNEAQLVKSCGLLFFLTRQGVSVSSDHESEQYFDEVKSMSNAILDVSFDNTTRAICTILDRIKDMK